VIGFVDGSKPVTTQRFDVVLRDNAVLQLDDLVMTRHTLADCSADVTHYGIVVEGSGSIEGAQFSSDTRRIGEGTMPGLTTRTASVQMLRTVPEIWVAPSPGATVELATGEAREQALFVDQMEHALPVGLDLHDAPLYADFSFISGERGGHVSISGVSGVATKTSYATFLLYQLLETEIGRAMLGTCSPQTHAVIFNVKGEDLLHLDRPNRAFRPEIDGPRWARLGVENPAPFSDVEFFVPRAEGVPDGSRVIDITSRRHDEVTVYGWTPLEFIRRQLLRFCIADDSRTQVPFVEQHVRLQLARHAFPSTNDDGSVVLVGHSTSSSNIERVLRERREPRSPGDGYHVESFADLLAFLRDRLDSDPPDPIWGARYTEGTRGAFLRRLEGLRPRIGRLVGIGLEPFAMGRRVSVIDLHALHDDAQRFVVGAILSEIFDAKQGSGREPLRFIMLDELNKYAPREGHSPIKDLLVDIAARGRSLGVLLIGAQQSAGDVERAITTNAALKIVGRLDAATAEEYRFLSAELRGRATRFLPGTMVLDQPLVPAPIPFRFPMPPFATNTGDDAQAKALAGDEGAIAEAFRRL